MAVLQKKISYVNEPMPGEKWLAFYQEAEPSYRSWFLKTPTYHSPSLEESKAAFQHYMPELYPMWTHLCELIQADEVMAHLLTLYCPPRYVSGCSQAIWSRDVSVLVRNYDYSPNLFEGRVIKSKWFDTEVIAVTDSLWGVLDGMNEHGLCASLTFGGSDVEGKGFGVPLILRYILEFCKTTNDAIQVLKSVPVNATYNITLLDALNESATLELSPISPPKVTFKPFAVNHQGDFNLSNYALFSNSYEREKVLLERLYDPLMTVESFIEGFEYAPLYSNNYAQHFGTLYSAIYNPYLKAMEFRWPYQKVYQSFDLFIEQDMVVYYG